MLTDPPLLTIKRSFARIPAELLAALADAQTGHVVDAMNGRGAMAGTIKPVDRARATFMGTAFPVETGPSDNLAIMAAVAIAEEGDVIVAAADAFSGTAVCGDILAMMAQNAGCAGLVIDGMVRDLDGLEAVGIPIFARGVTPNSCVRSGPGTVGLATVAGGVHVEAGDFVMGDRDGVVVVPRGDLDGVIATVRRIIAAEGETIAAIERERRTHIAYVEQLLTSKQVKYVD